ncbi:sigma factor-like helix-turn-helix DNA-binding protein [Paenibacillus luteus]|uniref:sigma factor-like helix-turn-helix DNA-binding protein n=1 Tax=Paenibacillus luteus TaxID=2545753 RepID=UPI001143ED0B|nr:sigma-70 family RNA polymerase sigma factor [Paenibacillus luteus]
MKIEVSPNESVEKAFSSYVKSCLQSAQKDYFEKLRRDSTYVIPLDAVTFEININFLVRHYEMPEAQNIPVLSQISELLHLSSKEQRVMCYKYYQDKTDKEIAQIFGISRQAVSKMKSNILLKLKGFMEN